ncbi:MAG: hypothetical protein J2P36_12380 [Ktedonobacteraceae bacterium]|nr:hypothetical protein [Ktedonobacteraceae bacterium]
MNNSVLCLVTIHGIGFQQPPRNGQPGYADDLHEHLSQYLDATLLCDDPLRPRVHPGQNGPIYVQSVWPPATRCREAGLRRLGSWNADHTAITIDPRIAPLSDGKGRIAHIALVYSRLEEQGSHLEAVVASGTMALSSLDHYTTTLDLVRTFLLDTVPLLGQILHPQPRETLPLDQRIRQDPGFRTPKGISSGLQGILRQLEDDVAAYVCYNDMRERVRNFVLDALNRLAYRSDVSGIIINAHSNGTVIALDVLNRLQPYAARKIRALITAGSPLRKYQDLFHWGMYMNMAPSLARWINVFDPRDPVADPLKPSASWVRGTEPTDLSGLYKTLDAETGQVHNLPIEDQVVNNIDHSNGGGLQAHNYWDNESEFIVPLATLLKQTIQPAYPVKAQEHTGSQGACSPLSGEQETSPTQETSPSAADGTAPAPG